jgi:hypothetical protein
MQQLTALRSSIMQTYSADLRLSDDLDRRVINEETENPPPLDPKQIDRAILQLSLVAALIIAAILLIGGLG